MASVVNASASGVAEEILCHIRECDRMYREVYGESNHEPQCNPCKKLMKMGFNLNSTNLPELCIIHCERWRIDGMAREQQA
jgi:hypothetical protein